MQYLKERYNVAIERFKKAEKWWRSEDATEERKEKFKPTYDEIVTEITNILDLLEKNNIEITSEDIHNGFKN